VCKFVVAACYRRRVQVCMCVCVDTPSDVMQQVPNSCQGRGHSCRPIPFTGLPTDVCGATRSIYPTRLLSQQHYHSRKLHRQEVQLFVQGLVWRQRLRNRYSALGSSDNGMGFGRTATDRAGALFLCVWWQRRGWLDQWGRVLATRAGGVGSYRTQDRTGCPLAYNTLTRAYMYMIVVQQFVLSFSSVSTRVFIYCLDTRASRRLSPSLVSAAYGWECSYCIARSSDCSMCRGVSAGIVKSGYGRTVPSSLRRRARVPSSPRSRRGRFGESGSDSPGMWHWRLRSESRKSATQSSSGAAISY
jgi:hypothetical protein